MNAPTLTIGILTLNEAQHLERCIHSARFANQIIIIDSGSTDDTQAIAQKFGVEFHTYSDWQGFAEQRNRLLKYVTTDYIFFLDADEVISNELAEEIKKAMLNNMDVGKIIWLEVAFGRPLKHFKSTHGVTRLFKRSSLSHLEGLVHEDYVLTSPTPKELVFKNTLLHYSRETVIACLKKLTQYVQLGAAKRIQAGKRGGILKGAGSALVLFFKLYIVRRGFTGGGAGFLFCFFVALECFFRYAAMEYDNDIASYTSHR